MSIHLAPNFSTVTGTGISPGTALPGNQYTSQHGDTLPTIAQRYGVSLPALQAANPQILNPDVVYPGQTIQFPANAQPSSTYTASPAFLPRDEVQFQRAFLQPSQPQQTVTNQFASAAAAAAGAPAFPTTRYGDTGANVKTIQYLLRAHGIPTDADGSFGPKTAASVKKFQSRHGFQPTGVADAATMAKLAVPAQYLHPNKSTVSSIQVALNKHGYGLAVDGSFGNATRAAVRAFQTKNDLPVNGKVETKTWEVLLQAPTPSRNDNPSIVPIKQAGAWLKNPQEQWTNCGPASFVTALLAAGKTPTNYNSSDGGRAAVNYARHTTFGMTDPTRGTSQVGSTSSVVRAFEKYGVSAYQTSSLDKAMAAARNGDPSLIAGNARVPAANNWWPAHVSPNGGAISHWWSLAGYNPSTGKYIVSDPLSRTAATHEVTAAQLAKFYHGGLGGVSVITR